MNVRRISAALLGTALLMPTSGCGGNAVEGPSAASGPAECPSTFSWFAESPGPSPDRNGDLVGSGADTALLCVYPFNAEDSAGSFRLGQSLPATKNPDRVTSYLNGLSAVDPAVVSACAMMGRDQYQIALGYPAGTHTVVRVEVNCGRVSATGATRRLQRTDTLLAFWPLPAATG
ncbi:hypothetical protein KZZ52_44720 [Dactylosporangium sp. AC04546]|uniref:hypothetical protein n=1 Tax=Dactylosporangium sp. AC04546 TaxID=2862460 RepID=UPI001EDDA04D|nr:hypothetical protein [Dactylosporangium sp. AC04546]WVK81020.1 hypothetical protein KZZ52_44720 [Dactylosporangium sp. AC04546]